MQATYTIRAGLIAAFALTMAACTTTGDNKAGAAASGGNGSTAASAESKPASAAGVGGTASDSKQLGATNAGATVGGASAGSVTVARTAKDLRSVYYEFDMYSIKDQYKSLIEANAKFLSANPNMKLTVQGNADERGSREYNLALGQRRADGVRRAMVLLGVRESQVDTVSFGEEKPRSQGHAEQAWAQNRRSDMLYQDEQ
jgi:peptidoglycan-associated lipoprotein